MKVWLSVCMSLIALQFGGPCLAAGLAITEIVSRSEVTEDWFEITNFGDTAADITDWSYDDESADVADKVALVGVTSIAAGESVVVLQIDSGGDPLATQVSDFRSFWGGLAGVQIATVTDAAGLGRGDGVTLFDAADQLALQQFYGDGNATDPQELIDDTHAGAWAGGEDWDSANFTVNGWVGGSAFEGQLGIFASSSMNSNSVFEYASPGFAAPEPTAALLACLAGFAGAIRFRF